HALGYVRDTAIQFLQILHAVDDAAERRQIAVEPALHLTNDDVEFRRRAVVAVVARERERARTMRNPGFAILHVACDGEAADMAHCWRKEIGRAQRGER